MNRIIFIFLSHLIILCGCQKQRTEKIIGEMLGDTIRFPSNMSMSIMGERDTMLDLMDCDYKIIMYVDSTNCMTCTVKPTQWNEYVNDLSDDSVNVIALLVFNPREERKAKDMLYRAMYEHPVYIDKGNRFKILNNIPEETELQTVLLNRDNVVLAVGNPVIYPRVRELYDKIMHRNKSK